MAKLTGGAGIGGNRRSAFSRGIVITSWRGIPVIRLKRTGRRKKISPKQAAAMDTFSELANAAKRITTGEFETAVEMSKHSQYLWRDLYFMALTGRLWTWDEPQTGKWVSMAARTTMSDSLDALGSQYASILIRGLEFWEILPPGEAGQVLTTLGPDAAPAWGPGGGSGAPANVVIQTNTNGTASSTWPKIVSWNAASNLDWPAWSLAAPDIIQTPDVPGRIRATYHIQMTNSASATTWAVALIDVVGGGILLPSTASQFTKNSTSWQNSQWTAQGVWEGLAPSTQLRLQINCTPAISASWQQNCFIQLEFLPD